MWLVPGKGRVVKRRCKIVICGMRLDEHPPWPRELPLLPHPRADTETNLSGARGSCSLSPTCPRNVLGALRAADHLEVLLIWRGAVKLKCHRHCEPGRHRGCVCSVPADRAWAAKTSQSRMDSARRGQEQEKGLSEAGDLNQAVAKGSAHCFWHSGERRGNTLVQSQLEMPN